MLVQLYLPARQKAFEVFKNVRHVNTFFPLLFFSIAQ